ncbi:SDR family oxidoreductase [Bacillus sp. FJAT-45037]|uniref:SDR family oxidoreductase n=1 Tax=Bacillus sp. FJAT-45037 TaxID=2011007 RepID=UPI000C246D85|nr:SDR family oxidoreductase [Bacillus sp. FJAT-45037]
MNIFLTGSTGFLGGRLIKNLVHQQPNTLYVLVRDLEKGEQLKATFSKEEQESIHLLVGDITKVDCGLSQADVSKLTGVVDVFYHLAALVKFDLDLRDDLFAINYDGTKHALNLAQQTGAKKFLYVSTAYTVGKRSVGVEELYDPQASYNNPYEESKVKSEHLVFSYADQMDVSILRPSIIVGDSKTGEADSMFTLYGFMRALEIFQRKINRSEDGRVGTYRLVANKEGTSNLVPVDYVADILSLAATRAEAGKIYNVTNPVAPKNIDLLNMLKSALKFDNLSVVDDATDYHLSPIETRLNTMVDVFNVYLSGAIQFEDKNTQALIAGSSVKHLAMSAETVQMIMNVYMKQPVR